MWKDIVYGLNIIISSVLEIKLKMFNVRHHYIPSTIYSISISDKNKSRYSIRPIITVCDWLSQNWHVLEMLQLTVQQKRINNEKNNFGRWGKIELIIIKLSLLRSFVTGHYNQPHAGNCLQFCLWHNIQFFLAFCLDSEGMVTLIKRVPRHH